MLLYRYRPKADVIVLRLIMNIKEFTKKELDYLGGYKGSEVISFLIGLLPIFICISLYFIEVDREPRNWEIIGIFLFYILGYMYVHAFIFKRPMFSSGMIYYAEERYIIQRVLFLLTGIGLMVWMIYVSIQEIYFSV